MIWGASLATCLFALYEVNWPLAFVSLATFGLSVVPVVVARYAGLVVPRSFMAGIILFIFSTLFLGEVMDFYNRLWWWDMVLHAVSAIGFGVIGFVAMFMLFQGDRFSAPHLALSLFAMCFAIAMGTMWEIFEFAMDQLFGFNMQKSGLMDTMGDLIINVIGALIGSGAGYLYLRGAEKAFIAALITEFVHRNPRFFGRARHRAPTTRMEDDRRPPENGRM